MWGDTIERAYWNHRDDGSVVPPSKQVDAINGWRQLIAYVSKYVAKTDTTKTVVKSDTIQEKVCGSGDSSRSDESLEPSPALENVTYSTAGVWLGRHWGVVNRNSLPIAVAEETVYRYDSEQWRMFAARARWAWRKYPELVNGFTLFTSEPGYWRDVYENLEKEGHLGNRLDID
jgi:hypothetical protein